jgi:hypothetical protein
MQVQKLPIGSPQRLQGEQTLAMVSHGVNTDNYSLADRAATSSAFLKMRMGATAGASPDDQAAGQIRFWETEDPKYAEVLKNKYVPGVGMSSIDVPKDIREKIGAFQNVDRMMGEIQNFNKTHPYAAFSPKDKAAANTLMNNLSDSVRQAADQGVYKESEANFMKKTIGDSPASFMHAFTSDPHIQELRKNKQADYQNLLKNAGFGSAAGQAPQQQASNGFQDGQTASDKSGNRVIFKNGSWQPYSNVAKK